ncbi:MAG: hypothetical protein ABWJ42_00985 [Sulfolobales archaeon]
MLRILIENTSIVSSGSSNIKKRFIERGYVYIRDGFIKDVGEGESPEEYRYPDLLIEGESRLVAPGLIDGYSISYLTPLKHLIEVFKKRKRDQVRIEREIKSLLSDTDIYYLLILGIASRILRGITTVVTEVPKIDLAIRILDLLSVRLISVFDIDEYKPEESVDFVLKIARYNRYKEDLLRIAFYSTKQEVIKSIIEYVPRESVILIPWSLCEKFQNEKNIVVVNPPPGYCENMVRILTRTDASISDKKILLGTGYTRTSIVTRDMLSRLDEENLRSMDLLDRVSRDVAEVFQLPTGSVEKGFYSDIVVYDLSQPPAPPYYLDEEILPRVILDETPRIETIIIGREVVLDGGEILSLGSGVLKKAYRKLNDLVRDLMRKSMGD